MPLIENEIVFHELFVATSQKIDTRVQPCDISIESQRMISPKLSYVAIPGKLERAAL